MNKHSDESCQRFVERRARDWSLHRIAAEIPLVSHPRSGDSAERRHLSSLESDNLSPLSPGVTRPAGATNGSRCSVYPSRRSARAFQISPSGEIWCILPFRLNSSLREHALRGCHSESSRAQCFTSLSPRAADDRSPGPHVCRPIQISPNKGGRA